MAKTYEVHVFASGDKKYLRDVVAESEEEPELKAMAEVEQALSGLSVNTKVTSAKAIPKN